MQGDRLAERLDEPLGQRLGLALVLLLEQDGELVAADPRRRVELARAGADPSRDDLQQLVAGRVAEAVVHGLEVVEVEEEDGGCPRPAREQRRDALAEEGAVR
jgi:hypothetical protein